MQLVWYSLALSAMNTYCIQELARREKQLCSRYLAASSSSQHVAYRKVPQTHVQSWLQVWQSSTAMSSRVSARHLLQNPFTKRGGKPPFLMRFPFLHSPQGLYSLTVRAQGTSSTRAHFIKCHFGPNFTLWPTLPRQRKQNARCSLCLLPQQRFIHCSKKLPGIHSKPRTPSLVCPVTGQSAGLSSAHFWSLPIISSPAYSYLLSFFPSLLEFEL